jgi:hypothetical protein
MTRYPVLPLNRPRYEHPNRRQREQEDRCWERLYRDAAHHEATAAELVQLLEGDPSLRDANLALYLTACVTLHRVEQRRTRHAAISAFARSIPSWPSMLWDTLTSALAPAPRIAPVAQARPRAQQIVGELRAVADELDGDEVNKARTASRPAAAAAPGSAGSP